MGAVGVAAGYAAATTLLAYPTARFCLCTSPIAERDFPGLASGPTLAAVVAGAVLAASRFVLPELGGIFMLLTRGALFGSAYVPCWALVPGGRRAARDILNLVSELRSRPRERSAPAVASIHG